MQKSILLIVCLLSISLSAQKVKVKKSEVYIDNTKVAYIEKIKENGSAYYQVSNNDKTPLFKTQELQQKSLIYASDKTFPYRALYGDKLKDTIVIAKKNYWLSEKRVIEYAVEIGLLNSIGFDESKAEEILSKPASFPLWISENLEKEKKLLKDREFKVDRSFDDTNIYVESNALKKGISQLNKSMVDKKDFDIYQGDPNGEHILIGHGIYENGTVKGEYLFILNSKKVPLASYSGAVFKIYGTNQELSALDHDVDTLSGTKTDNSIKAMAIELIRRGVL
ncbi:MAG: hypothetical protein ABJN84_15255 [Flavobacteriaceae bacterium]